MGIITSAMICTGIVWLVSSNSGNRRSARETFRPQEPRELPRCSPAALVKPDQIRQTQILSSVVYNDTFMPASMKIPGWVVEKWNKIEKINTLGEQKIEKELSQWGFEAIHNIILCDDKGLTQIDHVVKTGTGFIVIEARNDTGFIFGNRSWRYWTRRVKDGAHGEETVFYNPIWQNHRHVRAMKYVISESYIPIIPYVVFAGNAYLDDSISSDVLKIKELSYVLFNVDRQKLDSARLEAAWGRLKNAAETSAPRRPELLAHMKSRQDWDNYDALPL